MLKLKTIRLYPTLFDLDVVVGGNQREVDEVFLTRYGLTEKTSPNECMTLYTGTDCELKRTKRIVVRLQSLSRKIIEHECIHVLWHLSQESNIEICYESQEWQACFIEYVIGEIINPKGYEPYPTI